MKHDTHIMVRMSKAEKARARAACEHYGRDVSDVVRKALKRVSDRWAKETANSEAQANE